MERLSASLVRHLGAFLELSDLAYAASVCSAWSRAVGATVCRPLRDEWDAGRALCDDVSTVALPATLSGLRSEFAAAHAPPRSLRAAEPLTKVRAGKACVRLERQQQQQHEAVPVVDLDRPPQDTVAFRLWLLRVLFGRRSAWWSRYSDFRAACVRAQMPLGPYTLRLLEIHDVCVVPLIHLAHDALDMVEAHAPELQRHGIDAGDRHGRTALHHAAENGDVAALQLLLRLSANPNALDDRSNSPLHFCCRAIESQACAYVATDVNDQEIACAKLLLAARADIDAPNAKRVTPFDLLSPYHVQKLLRADSSSSTPLFP